MSLKFLPFSFADMATGFRRVAETVNGLLQILNYSQGTFTPIIVGGTTPGTGTYTFQSGFYTRIGNRVFFNLRVVWSAHTGTGQLNVSGLPFVSSAITGSESTPSWFPNSAFMPATNVLLIPVSNVIINTWLTAGGAAQAITATGNMWITGSYLLP